MAPALTSIQYGQNPTRKKVETPREDRRKKKPKGETGPGKSGTSTVTKPTQDGTDGPMGKVKPVTGKKLLNLKKGNK
jgi:hypothetical protein